MKNIIYIVSIIVISLGIVSFLKGGKSNSLNIISLKLPSKKILQPGNINPSEITNTIKQIYGYNIEGDDCIDKLTRHTINISSSNEKLFPFIADIAERVNCDVSIFDSNIYLTSHKYDFLKFHADKSYLSSISYPVKLNYQGRPNDELVYLFTIMNFSSELSMFDIVNSSIVGGNELKFRKYQSRNDLTSWIIFSNEEFDPNVRLNIVVNYLRTAKLYQFKIAQAKSGYYVNESFTVRIGSAKSDNGGLTIPVSIKLNLPIDEKKQIEFLRNKISSKQPIEEKDKYLLDNLTLKFPPLHLNRLEYRLKDGKIFIPSMYKANQADLYSINYTFSLKTNTLPPGQLEVEFSQGNFKTESILF